MRSVTNTAIGVVGSGHRLLFHAHSEVANEALVRRKLWALSRRVTTPLLLEHAWPVHGHHGTQQLGIMPRVHHRINLFKIGHLPQFELSANRRGTSVTQTTAMSMMQTTHTAPGKCFFDTFGKGITNELVETKNKYAKLLKQKRHWNNEKYKAILSDADKSLKFFKITHFRDVIVENNKLDASKFTFADPPTATAAVPSGATPSDADLKIAGNLIIPTILNALADQRTLFETTTKEIDGKLANLASRISQLTTALSHVTDTVDQIAAHTGTATIQSRTPPTTPIASNDEGQPEEKDEDYDPEEENFDDMLSPRDDQQFFSEPTAQVAMLYPPTVLQESPVVPDQDLALPGRPNLAVPPHDHYKYIDHRATMMGECKEYRLTLLSVSLSESLYLYISMTILPSFPFPLLYNQLLSYDCATVSNFRITTALKFSKSRGNIPNVILSDILVRKNALNDVCDNLDLFGIPFSNVISNFHCIGPSDASGSDRVFALIPKNGFASVIDRLTFSAGGIALDSGFSGYNVVSTMKENIEKSAAKYMSDDKVLNQSILESIDETGTYEAANFGQQKQLILANFLGFSGCEPTFLDLNRLPEVFLTIQVTSPSVLPVQYEGAVLGGAAVNANPNFSGNGCSYTIDNIFFTIEVISIGNGLYDALTSRLLEEKGSLDVPYKNFNTFTTDQSSAGGSIRGSVSTMSLDKVFAFQRNSGEKKAGGSPYEQYYIQQAPVPAVGNTTFGFTNAGLQDWFFQINNAPYPLYKPDTVDAYAYA
ncbi:hypothetical protein AURANDRAFT_68452, partial [Aureococcus anophagefferens]